MLLAGALTLAGGLGIAAGPAQAQIGTYEDFPYQQGSLFYRPSGNPLSRRAYAPRRTPAPTYYSAPQPAYPSYYMTPGGSYYYYTQPQYQYGYQPGLFRRFP
jgi:hypothetical protein